MNREKGDDKCYMKDIQQIKALARTVLSKQSRELQMLDVTNRGTISDGNKDLC